MGSGFQPVSGLRDVLIFRDCCNVYLLKDDEHGILIDLGNGAALDHLQDVEVRHLDGIYFTHAHRDQCQGAEKALAAGIPLHFPAAARRFVIPAERPDLTDVAQLQRGYPYPFDPPRPFHGGLFDIQLDVRLTWRRFDIETQAIPGHIGHQVAYLVDVGEKRLCFCGDAIHSAGKVWEAYNLETDHYTGRGAREAMESLRVLKQSRPTTVCPSHGDVIDGDCWDVFEQTGAALSRLAELKDTICPRRPHIERLVRVHENKLMSVSPHVWVWNNSYFLASETGGVLIVDAQGALPDDFWTQWREQVGDRRVETVLVTHVHCDHVEGVSPLQAWQRTHGQPVCEVWAQEQVADCIEAPHRYRRPYMPLEPTPVDRRLAHRERFMWHEYEFVAYHMPGQTDLHAGYETTVDGRHVIFSGDNFFPAQQWGGTGGLCGYNGGHPDGWRISITLMMEIAPDWVLASHIQPHRYHREDYEAMLKWTDLVNEAMRAVSPDGQIERHHHPHFIALQPYTQDVQGKHCTITAHILNPYDRPVEVTLTPRVPDGFVVDQTTVTMTILPHHTGEASWTLIVNKTPQGTGTQMVTVDAWYDGVYLGEKAECYLKCVS